MGKTGRKNKVYSAEFKIGMEHQKEILFKGGNAYIWKKEPKV